MQVIINIQPENEEKFIKALNDSNIPYWIEGNEQTEKQDVSSDEELELQKNNLQEWKAVLKKAMHEQYDIANFDETYSDEEWLESYTGYTPQDAIDGEVECWEE